MATNNDEINMMMLCAHDTCRCVINADQGVIKDDNLYCSHLCSEGKSCGHSFCNCVGEGE